MAIEWTDWGVFALLFVAFSLPTAMRVWDFVHDPLWVEGADDEAS